MSRKLCSTVPMLRSKRIPQIPETKAVKEKMKKISEGKKRTLIGTTEQENCQISLLDIRFGCLIRRQKQWSEKKWLHNHVVITPGGVTRRNRRDVIHMDGTVERVPPNTSSVDNSDGPTQTSSSPDRDIHQQQDSSSACQEHTPVQPELCRSRNSYTPTWN